MKNLSLFLSIPAIGIVIIALVNTSRTSVFNATGIWGTTLIIVFIVATWLSGYFWKN